MMKDGESKLEAQENEFSYVQISYLNIVMLETLDIKNI